jgi:small subunit ribosomal protein S1
MNENSEALTAPAQAVEANAGTPNGAERASNDTESTKPHEATAHASDAGAEAPDAADATDDGDEGDAEDGGADASAEGDPSKKKRRRRRKKKPGARVEGAEGEKPAGAPRERPAKEGMGGVFARFFDAASAGKRHAFSAGEVVAGRVVRVGEGAFAVDLFGKATAFVDIFEPHEVPALPEPPAPKEAEPIAPASAWAVPGADASVPEAPAAEAVAAEGPSAEVATAEVATAEVATAEVAATAEATPPADDHVASAEAAIAAEAEAANTEDAANAEDDHAEEAAAEQEPEAPPAPELGSIFRGRIGSVAESGHVVLVNRIIESSASKKRIAAARDAKQRVRGLVYGFNRGGFDVLVEGIRVFCPASGMSLAHIETPEELLGQRLEFTVPPSKAGSHGLVVSRRGILERQQRKAAKRLFRTLTPGQRLTGRVTQVREFGVFVDLGGIEGLVHQSELSFSRGVRPEDMCKIGDEVTVQVLRVGEGQTRKERERVSLSMKAVQDDPWSEHAALLEPGTVLTGKVVRTTDFGAFIEIAPHIEGLLHISELGRELKHANQVLQEGEEIRVVVERADRKARRISLSKLSQAEEKSLEDGTDTRNARPPKPGQTLKVVVDKVEQAGLIVQVPGVFGRRGRGFIPNAEMGTERGTDHRRGFPVGTEIQVKVIGVDRDGGFRFSRKALVVDEEKRAVQDYRREAARQGFGTFGDLLRAKLEGSK